MNKLASVIRVAVILALCTVGFLFLFGEEMDENLTTWTLHVIFDKAFAAGSILLMVHLYKRWRKVDPWLMAYDKMCDEVMGAPTPANIGKDSEE